MNENTYMNDFDNDVIGSYKKKSHAGEIWHRLNKNKIAMLGLLILTIIFLAAVFADFICDYESMAIEQHITERLQPPGRLHWFGTDSYGRDLFARVIHGTRISLWLSFACTAISVISGLILGSVAGYFGGKLDSIIMRTLDCIMSIPAILLSLAIVAALGQGIVNLIIAMTVAYIPGFARIVRASVLTVIGNEYIEAAKCCGSGNIRIICKYVLPNALGPIIVETTMSVASVIKSVAGLSFIGLGIVPPTPEWGAMLSESREFMRYSPYLVIFPGLAIVFTSLALNLLGDGLRDALDPRLKD